MPVPKFENLSLREEEEEDPIPYENTDKSAVLQESKAFNNSQLNTGQCKLTIMKVIYLLCTSGETLQATEATELYFSTTKLLQSTDNTLRRLVYIMIKELSESAEHAYIAVNTLLKDMHSTNDMFKANAIRALRKITDPSVLNPIERYLKQAVVDKSDMVSSAAIVTGIHVSSSSPDAVKRWSGEVGEALKQHGVMTQYHALALLHKLRKNDRLSVTKLVQSVNTTPIRSPLALCLLIRMCCEVLKEDYENSGELQQFVVNSLKHSNEMVVFEAAKCLCSLKNVSTKELTTVVLVLQMYLTSHKPVPRFAAVRLLNKVATTHPQAVATTTIDLEALITDPNRNIATLAITTLLKSGSEMSIDRLLKQINTFLTDIADEFKIVVIDALKLLCVKFPHKHTVLLQFLSEALREEGGFEFKKAIVDAIITVIHNIKEAKEDGLLHLCEFIEDCEFTLLSQRILHLLGQMGPTAATPHRYIRYIYNRVILETPAVRAAAVSALAKFAAFSPNLRDSVKVLLKRVHQDNDDEVRDRAIFYSKVLDGTDEMIEKYIIDVANITLTQRSKLPKLAYGADEMVARGLGGATSEEAVIKTLEEESEKRGGNAAAQKVIEQSLRDMSQVPQLRSLGTPHKTTDPEHLTDPDAEYVVTYLKHSFPSNVVFQFRVKNTLDDHVLDNVTVKMEVDVEGLEHRYDIPIKRIPRLEEHSCYVVFAKDPETFPTAEIANVLCFTMKEVDPDTGDVDNSGTEDEYQLEDSVLNVCDYMSPYSLVDFHKQWDEIGELEQLTETFSLASMKTLQAAADEILNFLGMEPQNGTNAVPPKSKQHTVFLAGKMCTDPPCKLLVKARVFYSSENIVTLDFTIRGGTEELRTFLAQELVS